MTPLQSYNYFCSKFRQFATPLGMVITDPDFRVSFLTYCFSFMTLLYLFCSVYTIATYEFTAAIHCVALCGVGLQGPVKIYTAIVHAKDMTSQLIHNADLYQAIERSKSAKMLENTELFGRVYRNVILVFVSLVVATGWVLVLFPAVMYVFTHERYSILTAYIPFIDETELRGYIITLAFHLWCSAFACIGEFLADGLFITCVLHLWPMNDVMDVCVEDLNNSFQQNDINLARMQFRNILLLHKDFYGLVEILSKI